MSGSSISGSVSDLTAEWDDDERMDFMFSDFKGNRDVSPMDWDSKMDFWTALVVRSCRRRGTVCCSLRELGDAFRRKDKSPLGLPTVLQVMSRLVSGRCCVPTGFLNEQLHTFTNMYMHHCE